MSEQELAALYEKMKEVCKGLPPALVTTPAIKRQPRPSLPVVDGKYVISMEMSRDDVSKRMDLKDPS